jgi:hypothetical protein
MTSRADGLRRIDTATAGLLAASVAGMVVVGTVITHGSHSTTTSAQNSSAQTSTSGTVGESGDDGATSGTTSQQQTVVQAPTVSSGQHAVSSGS